MAEPSLLQLSCPACGGQLDKLVGGMAKCPFCSVHALLHQGSLRPVTCGTLPERVSHQEILPRLHGMLREVGFEDIPDLEVLPAPARYLMRRGRVRTQRIGVPEIVREGLFGLPWSGQAALAHFLPDASGLVPADTELPGDMSSKLLAFEDHIVQALERQHLDRGQGYSEKVLYSGWTDDLFVITLPVETWTVKVTSLPAVPFFRAWHNTRPDGRYFFAVDQHSGQVLLAQLPYKGVRGSLVLGAFLLFLFLFVACTTLPGPLIAVIVVIAEALGGR